MAVKMSDIAKAAGVSLATVGRVLHNNGYVSDENRKKVEAAVLQYGYVPNRIAQGLKNRQSGIIGHVIPISYNNTIYARISGSIDRAAEEKGFHVLTLAGASDSKTQQALVNDLIGLMVEGIIFTSNAMPDKEMLMRITDLHIPVVMVERAMQLPQVDAVLVDNVGGSFQAVWHMVRKGHRRIAFIGKTILDDVEQGRYDGYVKAMSRAGLETPPGCLRFLPEYSQENGFLAMRELMELETPPTAVFMTSDMYACGALQYLYEKHLRIPEDVSLIGYDNTFSQILSPPLTSVDFSMDIIGRQAVEMLTGRIENPGAPAKTVWLDTELVDRDSVCRLTEQTR